MRVLRNHNLPSASSLFGDGEAFVFQQDNAPCHKANKVTRFLERSHVGVLQWPDQSPEGSSLWEGRGKQARWSGGSVVAASCCMAGHPCGNCPEPELVHSMPRRCAAVIAATAQNISVERT